MQGSLVHKKEIKLYNEIEYCPVGIHLFIPTLMIAYIYMLALNSHLNPVKHLTDFLIN